MNPLQCGSMRVGKIDKVSKIRTVAMVIRNTTVETFFSSRVTGVFILFESKTPTPIAKKTMRGTNRYGWFVISVKPAKRGADKSTPVIKTMMESACSIPLLDVRNSPIMRGSKNTKTNPSNCRKVPSSVNPAKKS